MAVRARSYSQSNDWCQFCLPFSFRKRYCIFNKINLEFTSIQVRGKRSISSEAYANISYDLSQLNHTSPGNLPPPHQDTTQDQSQSRDAYLGPNKDGVILLKQEDTVAGPDMLYAEWDDQNFGENNEVDKDYENMKWAYVCSVLSWTKLMICEFFYVY